MYLICHVTLYQHLIAESCEFMGESSLKYVSNLISLVSISTMIAKI